MANIMINQVCNLACPYCFASSTMTNKPGFSLSESNITLDNFKKALDFVGADSGHVGIIGGEPTLHPQFKEILEIVISNKNIKQCLIFTNGVNIDKYINILMHPKFSLLVNVNSPANMGKGLFDKMVSNLDELNFNRYYSNRFVLGINMYKPDFEYDYILELLERYKKVSLRVAIAVPNDADKFKTSAIEYFKIMKPRIFEFFSKCDNIGVTPSMDCNGFPLCTLSSSDREFLTSFYKYEEPNNLYCNLLDGNLCSPVIDIMPDMSVKRCFGVSSGVQFIPNQDKVYLGSFKNLKEVSSFFTTVCDSIALNIPATENCKECKQFVVGKCLGGCIGFKLEKLKKARNIIGSL